MQPLLKPLRYVFYRILEWKLRDPRESMPVLVAAFGTVLLLFFNVVTATMLVNGFRGQLLLPNFPGERVGLSVALLLSFIVGYNIMNSAWVEKQGYHRLKREFESVDRNIGKVRDILFWGYIAVTVLLPLLLSIFWHPRQ